MIFINENLDINLFNKYSKLSKKYNEINNNKILKNIKNNEGLTIKTLYYWLKMDNIEEFNKAITFNNSFFDSSLINNKDVAILYYNMNPNQFLFNTNMGWYVYNKNNILEEYGKKAPSILLNDIANKIHDWLNSLKNAISLSDENKKEKFNMISKAYLKTGMSNFTKGVAELLEHYYNVHNLDEKMDANKNVLAFDNLLYDLEIGRFRKIMTTDYIKKNTTFRILIYSLKNVRQSYYG